MGNDFNEKEKKIDILNEDEILDFYGQIGKGRVSYAVSMDDFSVVYEKYLNQKYIYMVVFSKTMTIRLFFHIPML